MGKYFTPANFDDFENMQNVDVPEVSKDVAPTAIELANIRARLEHEFKNCEAGLSKLCRHTVQASSTTGTKNLFSVMFENFGSKTIIPFLEMVKQDYGLLVAEWAATEIMGPFCPNAMELAGKWRNRG